MNDSTKSMNASQVLHELHGVRSRSDDQAVTAEVSRLNRAARQAARGQLTGWDQPGHFSATLIANADSFQVRHSSIQNRNQATGLIARLGEALRRRELSVGKLVERSLQRAAEAQLAHRPFIEIFYDKARASARKLDEEIAQGRWRGPLHGIPLAHKDCLERLGRAPTVGSIATDLVRPDLDATVLSRLEQAGSVDIGALNLNEMVAGPTGHNPHFGDCANAINPSRIGGGSSSGSAVAVRMGIVAASLGSDTGGSIRIPAAVNGVPGLKPTYGRISRAGCFPRAFSLDCIGPIAASIDDCELLFNAVADADPRDPSSIDRPSSPAALASERPTDTSRVAVLGGYGDLSPDVQSAFNRFVTQCEAELGPLGPQRTLELHTFYAMGDIISKVEAAAIHGDWMARHPERYSQAVYSRTEPGFHLPAVRYVEAINLRARLLAQFIESAFDDADVLVFPALPVPVPTRIEADMEQGSRVFPVVAQLTRLTRPFSYLGLPVLTIPIGDDRNGMPVAAQLIGLPFGEARLFDVARRLMRDRPLCDDSRLLRD